MKISDKKNDRFIFLLFLIGFLLGLGVDLYVPSLPAITKYFSTQPLLVQSSISLYMFGYGIAQIFFGIASDCTGRRKILCKASLAYALISFFIAYSPSILVLDLLRFAQGIAVAGLAVVGRAMLVDCFSGNDLVKASSWFGLSWSLGPIIGPFIGSYLQLFLGWHGSFYFFSFYGFALYAFIVYKIPETAPTRQEFNTAPILKTIQKVASQPIFIAMTMIGGLGYAAIVAFNIMGPFILQELLGFSVIDYAYIALLLGLSYFLGCTANRIMGKYFSADMILIYSCLAAFFLSCLFCIATLHDALSSNILLFFTLLIFFCCGFIVPCTLAKSMSIFPQHAGTASSIFGALSGIIVAVITIFSGMISLSSILPLGFLYIFLFTLSVISLKFSLKTQPKIKYSLGSQNHDFLK